MALQKSKEAQEKGEQSRGPTARDFDTQFLANVDTTHHHQRVGGGGDRETSHVVLYDIDNCGGEFEQIADAFLQSKFLSPFLYLFYYSFPFVFHFSFIFFYNIYFNEYL